MGIPGQHGHPGPRQWTAYELRLIGVKPADFRRIIREASVAKLEEERTYWEAYCLFAHIPVEFAIPGEQPSWLAAIKRKHIELQRKHLMQKVRKGNHNKIVKQRRDGACPCPPSLLHHVDHSSFLLHSPSYCTRLSLPRSLTDTQQQQQQQQQQQKRQQPQHHQQHRMEVTTPWVPPMATTG
jgi:hypothetical protein